MSAVKPLWYRWARVYFAGGCLVGTGVLFWYTIRPTDEQLIARFSPEVKQIMKEIKSYDNKNRKD